MPIQNQIILKSRIIHHYKRIVLLQMFFCCVVNNCIVNGQNNYNQNLPQIIPPSPNASALAQYADIPVSNYTGIPNISIPLFDVKSGKIDLPVTLSYHASGIKVAQEASWVGLGWALNAGGMITRQIRGNDDLKNIEGYGYVSSTLPYSSVDYIEDIQYGQGLPNGPSADYSKIDLFKSGHYDGQPDVFYYNFFGYSGKLIFQPQSGNIIKAISVDQNNIIFLYNKTSEEWTVTDGNGWKYYFGNSLNDNVERTTNYAVSRSYEFVSEADVDYEISHNLPSPPDDPKPMISGWYITKVLTPEGDQVDFEYSGSVKSLSQITYSENFYKMKRSALMYYSGLTPIPPPGDKKTYSASRQLVEERYIKKIKFNNGYIEFITEERDDLKPETINSLKPGRIKSASLLDLNGKLIKQFDLKYSYFNENSPNYGRLRLDSVEEVNGIQKKPPYLFFYNETALPEKTSYSIDYWGYYNGAYNQTVRFEESYQSLSSDHPVVIDSETFSNANSFKTLIPSYSEINTDTKLFLSGANREIDKDKIRASTLESIQYPTGGKVNFTYEANDYSDSNNLLYEYEQPVTLIAQSSKKYPSSEGEEAIFTINNYTAISLSFYIYGLPNGAFDFSTLALEDINGNPIISVFNDVILNSNGSFTNNSNFILAPGTYKLKAHVPISNTIEAIAELRYTNSVITPKKLGPGLRIKEVVTTDNSKIIKQKKYIYNNTNGTSNGRLVCPNKTFYDVNFQGNLIEDGIGASSYLLWYLIRSSGTVIPLGNSAQGALIGYDKVKILECNQVGAELGESIFYYKNKEDLPSNGYASLFIPDVPREAHLDNGQLIREEYFNDIGKKIKQKTIEYGEYNNINIRGLKIHSSFINPDIYSILFYDTSSEWWHPESETETIYDLNGENPITTTTAFKYDNLLHKNLTETQINNSKGQSIKTINKYPSDLTGGIDETNASIITDMITNNVVNPVIKSEIRIDDVIVKSNINNYVIKNHSSTNSSNNMYLTKNVKLLRKYTLSDYDELIQFNEYDNYGNILQQQKTSGTPISYIWGYKSEFPIAKIENASYSDVSGYVSNLQTLSDTGTEASLITALNNLRTALPNAMVTTYTYLPLVGVSTITDPKGYTITYTYDSFGRLEFVKDNNGNILTENQYNYKQ